MATIVFAEQGNPEYLTAWEKGKMLHLMYQKVTQSSVGGGGGSGSKGRPSAKMLKQQYIEALRVGGVCGASVLCCHECASGSVPASGSVAKLICAHAPFDTVQCCATRYLDV